MTTLKRFLTLFLVATISAFSAQVWGTSPVSITFSEECSDQDVVDGNAFAVGDGITATFNKRDGGTDTKYYSNGTAVRWYGGWNVIDRSPKW